MNNSFEKQLTGGHPNSLGNTLQVVELVLNNKTLLKNLLDTYLSNDEVVRLRVSNALKRVTIEHPEWTYEYIDLLINKITKINQASTQWTLAILFRLMNHLMSDEEVKLAKEHLKHNLVNHKDWIVINTTMETLYEWSKLDIQLKQWLVPQLKKHSNENRKSISRRALKYLASLNV